MDSEDELPTPSKAWYHRDGGTYFHHLDKHLTTHLIIDDQHRWVAAVFQDQFTVEQMYDNADRMAASMEMERQLRYIKSVLDSGDSFTESHYGTEHAQLRGLIQSLDDKKEARKKEWEAFEAKLGLSDDK